MASLFATAAIITAPFAAAAPVVKDFGNYRGLLLYDPSHPRFSNDADALKKELTSHGWSANRILVEPLPTIYERRTEETAGPSTRNAITRAMIEDAMLRAYDAPGTNDSLKLFYYRGEGERWRSSGECKGFSLDEQTAAAGYADEGIQGGYCDDYLQPIWNGYSGPKILVYDSCYGGGMFDGSSDPRPADAFFMASSRESERSASFGTPAGDFGGYFTRRLLNGIRGGAEAAPAAAGEIDLSEIKAYLEAAWPPAKVTQHATLDKTSAMAWADVALVSFAPPAAPPLDMPIPGPANQLRRDCIDDGYCLPPDYTYNPYICYQGEGTR